MFSMWSLISWFVCCVYPTMYQSICRLCIWCQSDKVFIIQKTMDLFTHIHGRNAVGTIYYRKNHWPSGKTSGFLKESLQLQVLSQYRKPFSSDIKHVRKSGLFHSSVGIYFQREFPVPPFHDPNLYRWYPAAWTSILSKNHKVFFS